MGKLIVIEGSDASGKKTQSNLLSLSLQQHNLKVSRFAFPIYDSPTGRIVSNYLNGDFGPQNAIDPKIASIWYMMNRFEHKAAIVDALLDSMVICDRYVESNLGHQGGKIPDPAKRNEFFEWCEGIEYDDMLLPRPDLGIMLHVPWRISFKFAAERGAVDGHECDPNHLRMAEESYLQLAKRYKWHIVECTEQDNMMAIETIAAKVWKIASGYLNLS